MPNLSPLSTATTTATALSNLILVSPQSTIGYQPQNDPSASGNQLPPAILFHYEGEQTAVLESDITDHYVEDNTAIQNQIALRPVTITTHGFIGELNDVAPVGLATIQSLADKLTVVSAYVPVLSVTALIAYAEAFQLYQVAKSTANSAVSTWNTLNGSGGESVINGQVLTSQTNQTKQQVAFQQFFGYWSRRTLFTVQTPWAIFQNMAIQRLRAIQDAETNMISDFEITFKAIRKAQTLTIIPLQAEGRAETQVASVTDLGTSTPASSTSLSDGLAQNYPGVLS